jgi:peptidoglycan/xylan/chitin deacetylase (PgdA/CDA1 family)
LDRWLRRIRARLVLRNTVLRRRGVARGPAILMYHRIAEATFDPWRLAVSPARFEAQLDWLKRHRTVFPLDEFRRSRRKAGLPRTAVAITFDDGYACNAEVAAPLLEAYDAPATIFLATDGLSSRSEFWWDDLERMLRRAPPGEIVLEVDGARVAARIDDEAGFRSGGRREAAYMALWKPLFGATAAARGEALEKIAGQVGARCGVRASHRIMSQAQARALAGSSRITLGAHTIHHLALTHLSPDDRREEIAGSRDACAGLTGARPTAFAYPYGDYDAAVVEDVRAAGFEVAVTTCPELVNGRCDDLALPRLQVEDWPADRLAALLAAG